MAGKNNIVSLTNLVIVLLLCFVVAAAVLLSIGVPKAAGATCSKDESTGIVATVLGSVFAALAAAMATLGALWGRVVDETGYM